MSRTMGRLQNTKWSRQLRLLLHLSIHCRGRGGVRSTVFGNKNRKGWVSENRRLRDVILISMK